MDRCSRPRADDRLDGAQVFRRDGEVWTISFAGTTVQLRDAKGLHYLASLLRHPGRRFSALELTAQVARHGGGASSRLHPRAAQPPASASRHPTTPSLERARSAVGKRIREAVRRIHAHHPALGYHLAAGIRTGAHCIYRPDPVRTSLWTM